LVIASPPFVVVSLTVISIHVYTYNTTIKERNIQTRKEPTNRLSAGVPAVKVNDLGMLIHRWREKRTGLRWFVHVSADNKSDQQTAPD